VKFCSNTTHISPGVGQDLIRLSGGLEDEQDLIDDLSQALAKVSKGCRGQVSAVALASCCSSNVRLRWREAAAGLLQQALSFN
jgi:hypothetical protein